jgi:predicted transposase/invertase (TIGR01784 family)
MMKDGCRLSAQGKRGRRKSAERLDNAEKNRLLPLKSDVIFKMVFGGSREKSILRTFLTAILDLPAEEYDDIRVLDTHLKGDLPDEKLAVLDVQIKTKQGKRVDVEIQIHETPFMRERITGYAGKMLGAQVRPGDEWGEIKKVVSIVILDYNLIKDSGHFHNKYMLFDRETDSLFTDVLEIHTLELKKLPQTRPEMDEKTKQQLLWLNLIKAEGEEEVAMLAEKNSEIEKAYRLLKKLSSDEEVRLLYESREKALWDQQARVYVARKEGHAEGIAEGFERGARKNAIETARKYLGLGLSAEQVAQGSSLTIEEVRNLQGHTEEPAAAIVKRKRGRPRKEPAPA